MKNKINLQLAIYDDDVESFEFESKKELLEYLIELKRFDCIWLAKGNGDDSEIVISEKIEKIILAIKSNMFDNISNLHIQEYMSFEAAFEVALSMKEGHSKCYD